MDDSYDPFGSWLEEFEMGLRTANSVSELEVELADPECPCGWGDGADCHCWEEFEADGFEYEEDGQ